MWLRVERRRVFVTWPRLSHRRHVLTFVANYSSSPLIVDIDYDTDQNTPRKIEKEITELYIQIASLQSLAQRTGQKISKQVRHLEGQIRGLKSTRNTLVPIGSLHADILQEIFVISSRSWGGRAALVISWTSHWWRRLALETSALWSFIDYSNPRWLQTALARTNDRELEFHLRFDLPNFRDIVQVSLDKLHRTKLLAIHANSPIDFPILSSAWATPAPILVELSLHLIILPLDLFSGICPSLRSLTLTMCGFSWSSIPTHPGTTKFHITSPVLRISVDDLINRMQIAGPTLQELYMELALSSPPPQLSASHHLQPRIRLERLTSLALIDSDPDEICAVLDQVLLPEHLDIHVHVRAGHPEKQIAAMMALIRARNLPKWLVKTIEVQEGLFEMVHEREVGNAKVYNRTLVQLGLIDWGADTQCPILQVLEVFPHSAVKHLSLDTRGVEPGDTAILDYFSVMGTVELLTIHIGSFPTFIRHIISQNRRLHTLTQKSPNTKLVLNEKLVKICLDEMSFQGLKEIRLEGHHGNGASLWGDGDYNGLRYWLAWRNLLKIRLHALVLFGEIRPATRKQKMEAWFGSIVDDLNIGSRMDTE
ncbi:hypothetical protein BDN72DRAFT_959349 [Pluteus cervinus]|uniref:Uncharacterized protein n=1 Tax=Pluteus cervinus TaxID=181527 RepID=A0ACD3AUS9_9AGAR|nr:hypothetical protein BDN72DRAFT_959349 [Pluteus cervinus]